MTTLILTDPRWNKKFQRCLLVLLLCFSHEIRGLPNNEIMQDRVLPCQEMGGSCFPSNGYTCNHPIKDAGCKEDEMCCNINRFARMLNDFGLRALCKTSAKCKNRGGHCFDRKNNPACDGKNNDYCGSSLCSCCIQCDRVSPSKSCKIFGGICQKSCDDSRIDVEENCGSTCKCCGCETYSGCSSYYGHCIKKGSKCDGTEMNMGCARLNKCTCCIPDCKQSTTCYGRCDRFCNDEEEVDQNGKCDGNGCQCCVLKEPPMMCTNSSQCEGHCRTECHLGEDNNSALCDGYGCTCCTKIDPQLTCASSDCCEILGGFCDTCCVFGEEITIPNLCPGKNCSCCVPALTCNQSDTCTRINGQCANLCPASRKSIPHLCDGPTCTCCAPAEITNALQCHLSEGYCFDEAKNETCNGICHGICDHQRRCCLYGHNDGEVDIHLRLRF